MLNVQIIPYNWTGDEMSQRNKSIFYFDFTYMVESHYLNTIAYHA